MTTGTRPPKPGPGYVWDGELRQWVLEQTEEGFGYPTEIKAEPPPGIQDISGFPQTPKRRISLEPPTPEQQQYKQDIDALAPFKTPENKYKLGEAIKTGISRDVLTRLFGEGFDFTGSQPEPGTEQPFAPIGKQLLTGEFGQPEVQPLPTPKRKQDSLFDIMQDVLPDLTVSYGLAPEEAADVAVQNLFKSIETPQGQQDFITKIREVGWNPNTEALLLGMGVKWEDFKFIFPSVFEPEDIQDARKLISESPEKFVEMIQTGGRTKEKQDLLLSIGFNQEQMNELFRTQRVEVPVDGVPQKLRIDELSGNAFDAQGNFAGKFNPITKEFTKKGDKGIAKTFVDTLQYASKELWERGENFFLSVLPNIIYPEMPKGYLGGLGDFMNATNKQQRENFRYLYTQNKVDQEEWLKKHPDIVPSREFQEGALQHPELLKDPNYWTYETISIIPFVGAAALGGILTGGTGLPAVLTTAAIMAPSEGQAVYEQAVNAGAPEDLAAPVAAVAGGLIGLLESVGRLPLLKQLSPLLTKKFTQEASQQLVKRGVLETVKKFGRNFTVAQFSEVSTEVLQEIVGNAAVKVFNENQDLFENIADVAAKTSIATLPFSLIGGGASVSPQIKKAVDEGVAKLPGGVQEAMAGERGSIGKVPEPTPTEPQSPAVPEAKVTPGIPVAETKPPVAQPSAPAVPEQAPPIVPPEPPPQAVVPPVTPEPEKPKQSPIERIKQVSSEVEADISIAKKKIADIKTPENQTPGLDDVSFARLALNDANRLMKQTETLIKRLESGQEVSEEEIAFLHDKLKSFQDFVKFEAKSVEQAKNKLTDYIQASLPLTERGKLLDAVKNVSNQKQLDEVLARVDRIAKQSEQKRLRTDIIKELKRARPRKVEGIVKGRFGGDFQEELDIMNRSLKMTRDEALTKITTNQQAYEDGKMTYEDMIRDNSRLAFTGIEGMTSAELQETLGYIKTLKEAGRATRLQELETWGKGIDTAKKDITRVVTGGKEVEPGVIKEFTGFKSLLKRVEGGQVALTDFLDILSGTDKTAKPYSSSLNLFVDNRVIKSYNTEQDGLVDNRTKVKDNFMRIFEVKKEREANDILRKMGREKVNLGTFKNTEGKEVKLEFTKGQIIDAYNLMQASENLDTFTEGNKFAPEMMKAITDSLTSQEKAWADWQRSYLADYWQSINDVYEPLYGVKLGRNPNYWPRNRDIERSDVPEHILVQEDYNHFASVTNGSLKARTQNKIPFKFLDANAKLINHVTQMEHFKAWAFTIRDLRSVFMSRDIKNAIHQFYGQDILRKINDYINVLARGGIEKSKRIHILDTLRGNVAVSVLGVKPMIAIKQPTALLAYATEMPYADFVTGIGDFLKNPVANYKTLYEKSSGLRARYSDGQYERDIKVGVEGGAPRSISGKATWKENVLTLIQMGDKFGTVPGMWAKYKSELKAGATDAQAILEAEKLTNRTQNTSQLFTLTTIQHGGSWARLLTMFQDQPNKYFRLINSNFRNMINGRQGKAKSISNIILLWVVMPALFQWMSDAFKWQPERQKRAVILGPINMLLIFGQMAQSAVGWLTGEKYPYEPSPVLQIADDIQVAIGKVQKLIRDGQDPYKDISMEDVIAMIENFAKGVGMATGVPMPYLVQLERAARGQEGKRDWRELLFSRWALEEPKPDLKQQAEDEGLNLGLEKEITGKEAVDKKPEIYDMRDFFSEQKDIFSKTLPSDITEKNGFDKRSVVFGKALLALDEYNSQPNKPLHEIVDDIEKDESINHSVRQYYLDWQARLKIDSLAKLKEYDATHPRAFLGNLTQSKLALLLQYEGKSKDDRKKMVAENEALSINPRQEWLKSHPKENGLLTVFGQAKVLSQAAYDEAQRLIKELDIPDSAVEEFIPPKEIVKSHFEYEDAVEKFRGTSVQARFIRAKDDKFNEWKGMDPIDEDVKGLELKVKNYDLQKELESFSDKDSPDFKDDVKKDVNGLTERDRAVMQFKARNKDWNDDQARIDALSKGTRDKPTPDDFVDKWVDRGKVARESKGYDAEEKVWYLDNPDVHKWALENGLTTDDGSKWNGPVLRIQVKPENRKIDEQREILKGDDEGLKKLMATPAGKAWKDDQRRITAYQNDGVEFVESWVEHGKIIDEFSGSSAEAKVWLYDHRKEWTWALGKKLLSDEGQDWNIPVLRLNVQWRKQDTEYDAILSKFNSFQQAEQDKAVADYLKKNPEYKTARVRRSGYELGLSDQALVGSKPGDKAPIEKWVEYRDLPESGYWRARYRLDNPDFDKTVKAAQKSKKKDIWEDIDPKGIPNVQYDIIGERYKAQFEEYERADARGKAAMLKNNLEFADAKLKRDAYKLLIGSESYVPDYMEYYKIVSADTFGDNYEDDWYLIEHEDFYNTMRSKLGWKPRDFSKVPSREVWKAYQVYSRLTTTLDRHRMRAANLDLDRWLLKTGRVKESIETLQDYEQLRARGGPSEVEEYKQYKIDEDLDNILKRLEELLAGTRR